LSCAKPLESLEPVFHGFERFGGVPQPVLDLADNPQRFARAKRLRRIAPKLLVRQIGVVFNRARRLDDIDPAGAITDG